MYAYLFSQLCYTYAISVHCGWSNCMVTVALPVSAIFQLYTYIDKWKAWGGTIL